MTDKGKVCFNVAGIIVGILTVVFAIWIGLYICMYGGIVSIITGFSADPWLAGMIAWGVVKFLCTGVVAWLSVGVGFGLSSILFAIGD